MTRYKVSLSISTSLLHTLNAIMPRSHLHVNLFRKSHTRRFSLIRAGRRPRNIHIDPVTPTKRSRPTQFRENCHTWLLRDGLIPEGVTMALYTPRCRDSIHSSISSVRYSQMHGNEYVSIVYNMIVSLFFIIIRDRDCSYSHES